MNNATTNGRVEVVTVRGIRCNAHIVNGKWQVWGGAELLTVSQRELDEATAHLPR